MGHRHTREELLDGAVATAFEHGLSQLTFGRVAARLSVSDRIVVYYFPTKDDLVGEVLGAVALQLQEALAPAFDQPAPDHVALLRRAWPLLSRPEADPVFALFFEASGLAAAGRAPFDTLVPAFVEAWIAWAAETLSGPAATRRAEAEAAIATVDGLLLLRQLAGGDVADRAARRLGITGRARRR